MKRRRSRSHSPSFSEVVASSSPPHTGAHRRRPAKPAGPTTMKSEKTAKNTATAHHRHAAKRARNFAETVHVPSDTTVQTHVHSAVPLATAVDVSTRPAAAGAYAGKSRAVTRSAAAQCAAASPTIYELNSSWSAGMDGAFFPLSLCKCTSYLSFPALPNPSSMRTAVLSRSLPANAPTAGAFKAIRDAGCEANFPALMCKHRRGSFAAITVGLYYGQGHTYAAPFHDPFFRVVLSISAQTFGRSGMAVF